MKILVTFFCFFIIGLLIVFTTVDLEPFLTPENSTVKKTAINSSTEEMAKADASAPPLSQRAQTRVDDPTRDVMDSSTSDPVLSRITTHQLIVTEKRDNEKFGHKTKIEQTPLPLPDDNVAAPDSEQPGE